MQVSATFQLLFTGSSLHENSVVPERISAQEVDWELFIERSLGTHLAPLLHRSVSRCIPESEIPSNVKGVVQNAYNQVLTRNILLQSIFTDFVSLLNQRQIPIIPLKGIYLSEKVYEDLGTRHLSDIDVLLREEDLEKARALMEEKGWACKAHISHSALEDEQLAHAHPYTLIKNQLSIELHTHIYNQAQGLKISAKELWDDAKPEKFLGVEIHQFTDELLFQHLCLHLHKHLIGNELKVLNFGDLREFLKVRTSFDWSRFESLNERVGCVSEVAQILWLCQKYWNVDVPVELSLSEESKSNAERLFLGFLDGSATKTESILQSKLYRKSKNLKSLETNWEKLRFLLGYTFPKKDFMRRNYHLKKDDWLLPWYLYRPVELSVKTLRVVFGR